MSKSGRMDPVDYKGWRMTFYDYGFNYGDSIVCFMTKYETAEDIRIRRPTCEAALAAAKRVADALEDPT